MTALKMVVIAVVVAVVVVGVVSEEHLGQYVARRAILLDENFEPVAVAAAPAEFSHPARIRRDSGYAHSHKGYKKGITGPVYTFVKTDYNGNFKWGVRHRAGVKYAGGYHH